MTAASLSSPSQPPSLVRAMLLGIAAGGMFSSTFIFNRLMSLEGGHWAWSAALRYVDTVILLLAWLLVRRGRAFVVRVLDLYRRHLGLWFMAGGTGYGITYSCFCYAAGHTPAWVLSATWQITILATPIVMLAFGARVPLRGVLSLVVIAAGVVVVNVTRMESGTSAWQLMAGVLPVLLGAFAYPLGNQLLTQARYGGRIKGSELLADPAVGVLLLSLGAMPVFAAVVAVCAPPAPTHTQFLDTALVALVSGCGGMTLFIYARNLSSDPLRIAAVDATQASEMFFALLGDLVFMGAPMPGLIAWTGIGAVICGLVDFTVQGQAKRSVTATPVTFPDP
ncbi:multidrug resistance efflux transporter family protein [Komagataeibacter sp. FNDCF1]|uniref:multidrug resistance efflux transporter family protein n=1 Tax=Komagataeibacter sp. FNDCF1 TaxID=2878681 RepID=UPI001E440517|nr:multidrug resistance efflux transporter family protein [Komagataeibacter sp. FNDCF1]MCE2563242.1 multidrug resistance efflux transporter family protein [Komagataeibacter sp. FNDCF1]